MTSQETFPLFPLLFYLNIWGVQQRSGQKLLRSNYGNACGGVWRGPGKTQPLPGFFFFFKFVHEYEKRHTRDILVVVIVTFVYTGIIPIHFECNLNQRWLNPTDKR